MRVTLPYFMSANDGGRRGHRRSSDESKRWC